MRPLLTPVDWEGVAALIAIAIADLALVEHRPSAAEVDSIMECATERLRQIMLTRSVPQPVIEKTLDAMTQASETRFQVLIGSQVQNAAHISCD